MMRYDQEVQLENIFVNLSAGFRKLDKITDGGKQQTLLKELTAQMQEAKTLIREFEREARTDDMGVNDLNARKKEMVQQLNAFIGMKKAYSQQTAQRGELLEGAKSASAGVDSMSTTELMQMGRKDMKETDAALLRSERLVNDTIGIGIQTAETLDHQTKQLEKVIDDLEEIHFSMKKARQVIRDMARGLATDKCIMGLLLLVVLAIVALVVVKVTGVKNTLPGQRRLLWQPEELWRPEDFFWSG